MLAVHDIRTRCVQGRGQEFTKGTKSTNQGVRGTPPCAFVFNVFRVRHNRVKLLLNEYANRRLCQPASPLSVARCEVIQYSIPVCVVLYYSRTPDRVHDTATDSLCCYCSYRFRCECHHYHHHHRYRYRYH